jgi:dihydroorotate dehydrogenase (NAD+) catalytic subunit
MGGVETAQDAADMIAAGATLVGVGTALFRDPGVPAAVAEDLPRVLDELGVPSVSELVGLTGRPAIPQALPDGKVRVS